MEFVNYSSGTVFVNFQIVVLNYFLQNLHILDPDCCFRKVCKFCYNIILMQGNISNNLFANCHSTPFQEFFVLYHPLAKFVNCRTIILPKVVLRSVSFFKDQLLNCQMLLCIIISDQLFANHRPRSFSIVLAKFAIPLGVALSSVQSPQTPAYASTQ